MAQTKEEIREYQQRYYLAHIEKKREHQRLYSQTHLAEKRQYRLANLERDREYIRQYRLSHSEEIKKWSLQYYLANREQINIKTKSRRALHTERGLCVECSNKAIIGFTRCEKHSKSHNDSTKNRYLTRRENGICVKCNSRVLPGYSLCEKHLNGACDEAKRLSHQYPEKMCARAAVKRKARLEQHRCYNCGRQLTAGDGKICIPCSTRTNIPYAERRKMKADEAKYGKIVIK
jgi:hypothetical protein